MDADARRVAHQDEPVRQAFLEEPHAAVLRQQLVGRQPDACTPPPAVSDRPDVRLHQIESDRAGPCRAHSRSSGSAMRAAAGRPGTRARRGPRCPPAFVADRLNRHERRRRGQRVAAVARRRRARQRERLGGDDLVGRDHARSPGNPDPMPFPDRHDVGHHVVVIAAEHQTGAAEAGDHLVGDEQRAVLACDAPEARRETRAAGRCCRRCLESARR